MELKRGMRDKLDKYVNLNGMIEAELSISGPGVYDFCCFGVDANDKLSDDRYMIFYNQTSSPQGEITYRSMNNSAVFGLNISKLPTSINKLVFTVSIDGESTMGNIRFHTFTIRQNGNTTLTMQLSGSDFKQEKAIIAVEIYRKDQWRINAVARGFNGGLGDLLRAYGGEEEAGTHAPSPSIADSSSTAKVSLEKKLEKAPQLVSLAKPIKVELEKRNLQDTIARVGLVMDISGSMGQRYRNGTVQEIVNHILPIAVQFDDDGELDFWYYGSIPRRMDSVNVDNYKNAVPKNWESLMASLGYGNYEPAVMELVINEYQSSKLPAYVIFVTDGGVGSANEIKSLITKASKYPIFWQFVGVGGSDYGVLKDLDNMGGRYVDNANFFALDDFRSVSDKDLYARLLNEFPKWLKEIKAKRMI